MRYYQISENVNVANINKMLGLRIRLDRTFPLHVRAALGRLDYNNPKDMENLRQVWYKELDKQFRNAQSIDFSAQREYRYILDWITNNYIKGFIDFEDLTGQGIDDISRWLVIKNNLNNPILSKIKDRYPTDLNSVSSMEQLHTIVRQAPAQQVYNDVIEKILFNRQKQLAKEYVLIDNDSFRVTIPLNFGACYVFAHGDGHKAHYCTSSSSGVTWFNSYKKSGLLIDILDKNKLESKNGKWQIHANSGQIKNATQDWRVLSDDDHIPQIFIINRRMTELGLLSRVIALETYKYTHYVAKYENIE